MRKNTIAAANFVHNTYRIFILISFALVSKRLKYISYSLVKKGKPVLLAPLLPLSFALAYLADLAYGNKIHRIRGTLLVNV